MNKHQLFILGIFLFAGFLNLNAQSGPVSTGGDATGSGGTVSYSIGQIDYVATNGSGGNSNEGLQQPYEIFTFGVQDQTISLQLSVYPNPTTNSVFLKIEKEKISDLSFQILDVNGKQICNQNISDNITQIDLESFSSGSYILQVIQLNNPIQSFKIIKK